ncbi:ABC transporter substrate-binding protein [Litorilinea aerophila]|uniref:Polyamine ABC transporter substrate-binding protein n=1 Tax=Litorilinea aerophila TaxID=1204385 RepID=A0A540VIN1_9CHLR|nr:ABC transporter substrate-binding protein [Litorilinea aerophila]MCC9075847.1 ABC transporter substrate-binding protein [Litorilinea aerophila]GIV77223.1 MAG: ABC transporter substrate-binding protein [Litorilinea sp.]
MRKLLFVVALLMLLVVAGCAAPAQPAADTGQAAPATGGEEAAEAAEAPLLRFGINAADLGTLDPHFASSTNDRTVVSMIFNGLVRYKPGEAPEMEPDLATAIPEPEIVDGKQVWTFELRQGVMCHPSPETEAYELTADDVVYSLTKSANPDRSAYAGEYTGMTVEKVDDYTVRITLDQPLSPVLFLPKVADYAGGFIVCSKAVEALGDEAIKTHPVGTGPFMFDSYTPQDRVRLVANPDYFRGQPKLGAVEVRYMPDISSRELGLKAGELDVISGLDEAQWIEDVNSDPNLQVDVFGVGEVATIHFNTTVPPLDNPDVRKAIAYALNRDEFLALFGPGVAENVYSPVPAQFMPGGLTKEEVEALGLDYSYNPEKARELLAQAGLADGFSLSVVSSEMPAYRKIYESMQAQLAAVGINLQVDIVDHSTMHTKIREDVNPIVVYVAFRPNADVYLTRFFHSDSIVVTGAKPDTNFSHYDKIDDLIEAARVETDPDKQIELWKQAQIQILEDMVAHTLMYQNQVYARNTAVDYGHPLKAVLNLNPQITEQTQIVR